jgi:hypothetical protein
MINRIVGLKIMFLLMVLLDWWGLYVFFVFLWWRASLFLTFLVSSVKTYTANENTSAE